MSRQIFSADISCLDIFGLANDFEKCSSIILDEKKPSWPASRCCTQRGRTINGVKNVYVIIDKSCE